MIYHKLDDLELMAYMFIIYPFQTQMFPHLAYGIY